MTFSLNSGHPFNASVFKAAIRKIETFIGRGCVVMFLNVPMRRTIFRRRKDLDQDGA